MTANSFGSRAALQVAGERYEIYRLDAVEGSASLPFSLKILLENLLRNEDGANITAEPDHRAGELGPGQGARHRDPVHPGPGHPAGPDRRAGRGGPGRDARGHAGPRRRPDQDQPAHPGRTGHRPLRGGRRVRQPGRVQPERGDRVPAQPRAVPVPALGPGRVQPVQGGPAGHRHRAPGEHRVPGPGGHDPRRRGLPRHLRGHRLAHHHAERPGRARLGRRRHRGRGRHARPAHLHAHPEGGRLPADRRAAQRRHRHRPGAHDHRDAAQARRGRQVRRVHRRGRGRGPGGQPGHDRQHVAGVRLHLRDLPDRPEHPGLPEAHRPPAGQLALVEAYAKEQGLWHDPERETRYSEELSLDLSTVVPSIAGPKRPQDRIALADAKQAFRDALPNYVPEATLDNGLAGTFPASDPVAAGDGTRASNPVQVTLEDGTDNRRGPRQRGHRRDHLLHQHLEPLRHGRRRAAGQERGRPGPGPQALGQDHAGAGLQGGHGLLRARRAAALPGQARLQPGRLRLHHLHRQLRAAAARDQRRR